MRRNVILINCDDLGYGDLGCYNSPLNDTPTIDALAREGVKFNSFYASSSVCTPSRASLLTGCYAQRVELPYVLFPGAEVGLNKDEYTLGTMFKSVGYNTMIVGKWHCGDDKSTLPCNFGFDDYFGLPYSNDMGRQKMRNNPENEESKFLPPLPLMHGYEVIEQQPDQTDITERYVKKSVEFIQKNKDHNFFLYLAHMHVHLPLYEQEKFKKSSRNGDFGACVSSIDWSVAEIVNSLKELDIYKDTMIIFTSDNGSLAKNGASNAPLQGAKFSSYEGGFRVPFIVHYKGHIKEGVEISNMASNIDLLPTLAAFIGADLGKNKLDGIDILKMLYGEDEEVRKEFVYYFNYYLTAIRKNNYKLHIGYATWRPGQSKILEPMELYDMTNDIEEKHNLIQEQPEVAKELLKCSRKYAKELGDTFTEQEGDEIRPCTHIQNPKPLTVYDIHHPYIVSMYDTFDRG